MGEHAPALMEAVDRINFIKRGGGGAGRQWRVWSWVYACPVCGVRKTVLCNPNAGKSFSCHGDRVVGKREAAA